MEVKFRCLAWLAIYCIIWQGYFTFLFFFIFDRIVCVLVTFCQWGHFVILIIRNLNLISVRSWTSLNIRHRISSCNGKLQKYVQENRLLQKKSRIEMDLLNFFWRGHPCVIDQFRISHGRWIQGLTTHLYRVSLDLNKIFINTGEKVTRIWKVNNTQSCKQVIFSLEFVNILL